MNRTKFKQCMDDLWGRTELMDVRVSVIVLEQILYERKKSRHKARLQRGTDTANVECFHIRHNTETSKSYDKSTAVLKY